MSADASGASPLADHPGTDAQVGCLHCGGSFRPRKRWQRFCSPKCRTAHHAAADGALRGVVSKVSVMRRGKVSVVVHFDLEDRERAGGLTPGDVIEVLRS